MALGDSVTGASASATLTSVPLMVNYFGVGSGNHRLELGAGVVLLHLSARAVSGFASNADSGFLAAGTGTVAYRYAPLDGGFSFKAGFTPLLSRLGVVPQIGIGLGAVF